MDNCPVLVEEKVCVNAEVQVEPCVEAGDTQWRFVGRPKIEFTGPCSYMVSQMICVQFPVHFAVDASAIPTGITCGTPALK